MFIKSLLVRKNEVEWNNRDYKLHALTFNFSFYFILLGFCLARFLIIDTPLLSSFIIARIYKFSPSLSLQIGCFVAFFCLMTSLFSWTCMHDKNVCYFFYFYFFSLEIWKKEFFFFKKRLSNFLFFFVKLTRHYWKYMRKLVMWSKL